jgi:hypothetical protein
MEHLLQEFKWWGSWGHWLHVAHILISMRSWRAGLVWKILMFMYQPLMWKTLKSVSGWLLCRLNNIRLQSLLLGCRFSGLISTPHIPRCSPPRALLCLSWWLYFVCVCKNVDKVFVYDNISQWEWNWSLDPRPKPHMSPYASFSHPPLPNKEEWWRQRKEVYYEAQDMWEETEWALSSYSAIFGVQTWIIGSSRQKDLGGQGIKVCIVKTVPVTGVVWLTVISVLVLGEVLEL